MIIHRIRKEDVSSSEEESDSEEEPCERDSRLISFVDIRNISRILNKSKKTFVQQKCH